MRDSLPVRIERAHAADSALVADLYLTARAASAMPPGVHPPAGVHRYVTEIVMVEHEVWLARCDGEPVGLMTLADGDLEWLFVLPDARDHGVGSALVAHAKYRRPDGLALWVFEVNTAARRFYERHGFVVVGGTAGDNEEGEPDLRMVWR